MEEFRYINNYTGELLRSRKHVAWTLVHDIIHYPGCRNFKYLFGVRKWEGK